MRRSALRERPTRRIRGYGALRVRRHGLARLQRDVLIAIVALAIVVMRRPRGADTSNVTILLDETTPPRRNGIHRLLIVTDDACSADDFEHLPADLDRPTAAFVVAPAVSSRVARWTGDEHAYRDAEQHFNETVQTLRELG